MLIYFCIPHYLHGCGGCEGTLEHATYSCPCEKYGFSKYTPATFSLANDIYKGICCLLNRDDKSFGIIGRRGIKIHSLLPISVVTVAFMTFGPRYVICDRVPLRNLGISRLRISSTGTWTINLGLSEGALKILRC
ncbi:hypothetical protein AVEN_180578-1 [Araneus ventricosus]|uniref:Uncharacterized protein n=1 Tax=Araneus ventricosus TaxID=182803 RepID=A0A4Y2QXV0_ARAVE|nr:hypothetical protein AVEN_180578-1 [Araneus ventricosus]